MCRDIFRAILLLAAAFMISSALCIGLSTYQASQSASYKDSFIKADAYKTIVKSIEDSVQVPPGEDAEITRKIISLSLGDLSLPLQLFTEKNLDNFWDWVYGKAPQLIIYVPVNELKQVLDPRKNTAEIINLAVQRYDNLPICPVGQEPGDTCKSGDPAVDALFRQKIQEVLSEAEALSPDEFYQELGINNLKQENKFEDFLNALPKDAEPQTLLSLVESAKMLVKGLLITSVVLFIVGVITLLLFVFSARVSFGNYMSSFGAAGIFTGLLILGFSGLSYLGMISAKLDTSINGFNNSPLTESLENSVGIVLKELSWAIFGPQILIGLGIFAIGMMLFSITKIVQSLTRKEVIVEPQVAQAS